MILAMVKTLLRGGDATSQEDVALEERTDEALMLLYSEGEVRAFEILLSRHERPIFNFILRSCRRRDVAEELMQEVFIRVIKSAPNYKQKAKFTTWLYTIARNICIDRARRSSRTKEYSLDETVGSDGDGGRSYVEMIVDESASVSHASYERKKFQKRLMSALEQLPEDQREVFLLKEIQGLKFREIADVVGAPVPTVKSRMRYALQALRGHLAEYREHSFDEEERMEVVPSGE